MKDLTPWRYKLTSIQYYLDVLRDLFKSKKKREIYGFIKYDRGDEVKVTIYSEIPEFWYVGTVLDINARYIVPSIESSWKVEYYVSFKNSKGSELRYWFLESELRKYSLQQERNSRIEQLLNKKRD
jgi:hypothetical protein